MEVIRILQDDSCHTQGAFRWNEIRNDKNHPNVFEPGRFNWDGSDWMKQKIDDLAQPFGFAGYPATNVSTR